METIKFHNFKVEIADRANPGVYSIVCGLTSKGFKRSTNMVESMVPDCDDESLPAEIQRGIASTDWSIDGAFTIDVDDLGDLETRYENAEESNIRITIVRSDPSQNVTYVGPAIISDLSITAEKGSKAATGTITFTGSGKYTRSGG